MARRIADTAARRAALLQAQQRYLDWLDGQPRQLAALPYRVAFNRLHAAVVELQSALQLFEPDQRANRARLLALLQGGQAMRPKSAHAAELDSLAELLVFLRHAAAEGGGNGRQVDVAAATWVAFAARGWVQAGLGRPSAAERGAFWCALAAFNDNGRVPHVPVVGRDAAAAALKAWRDSLTAWSG